MRLPALPVITMVVDPIVAVDAADKVKVELTEVLLVERVTVGGLKVAVTPLGRLLIDKETDPL